MVSILQRPAPHRPVAVVRIARPALAPAGRRESLAACVAVAWLLAVAMATLVQAAEIVDRVLAVVDGAIITQSDVIGISRLGLEPAADRTVAAVRDALIERRLILAEVDRYAPADPAPADVDRAVEAVRSRLGGAALDDILKETGGSVEQLRRYLRDTLRIESYLQQRFGAMPASDAELADYYRGHAAEFGGRSLTEARADIGAALARERRGTLVRDWIAGLRRRANINVLPD